MCMVNKNTHPNHKAYIEELFTIYKNGIIDRCKWHFNVVVFESGANLNYSCIV